VPKVATRKRAMGIIDAFTKTGILVVGDMMVDHFIWGKVSRISPEAPVPVVDVQDDGIMLGGCANVLNSIYAMGGKVYVSGVIGADNIGKNLLRELNAKKIETSGVVVDKKRPTTLKTRIVAHGQQVVRFDKESKKPILAGQAKRILQYVESLRGKIGAIIVSDYNKGVISRILIEGIRDIVKNTRVLICVDPKYKDFSVYDGAHIITPNHHEAQRAAGMEINNGDDLGRLSEIILRKHGFQAMLITRGEEGMSLFENGRKIIHTYFPARAREVYDVTGAGDTVIGVLALALAAGAKIKEATYLANVAAGIVVGKVGTSVVTREELIEAL